ILDLLFNGLMNKKTLVDFSKITAVKNAKFHPRKPKFQKVSSLKFSQIFQNYRSIFSNFYINKAIFPFFDMSNFSLKSTKTLVNRQTKIFFTIQL
ncbi:hypothetical protein ABZ848_49560, partial [Streptomyces sp. NPDC047081]|uniref:hypothetical protein n=1 Tax=Streptomyces sp. NPDC047081 TaxID=3154706 RepID=UPI0033CB1FA1